MTWRSEYFTLEELTFSQTATRRGIDNVPEGAILARLEDTALQFDEVRELLGHPIRVSSGYRSPALNRVIGGVDSSHHTQGWAVDFTCPKFGTPYAVAKAIEKSGIPFDQLIYEGTWVHISFKPGNRRSLLTAHFGAKTTYSTGIVQ